MSSQTVIVNNYSLVNKLPNSTPLEFVMTGLHLACLITVIGLGAKLNKLFEYYLEDEGIPINLNINGYVVGDTNDATMVLTGIAMFAYLFYYLQGIINSTNVTQGCCCTSKGFGIFMNFLAFCTSSTVMYYLLDIYKIYTGFNGCDVYTGTGGEEFCEEYVKQPSVIASVMTLFLVGSFIFSCMNKPLVYSSVASSSVSSSVTESHQKSILQQQQQPLIGQPQSQGNLQNV